MFRHIDNSGHNNEDFFIPFVTEAAKRHGYKFTGKTDYDYSGFFFFEITNSSGAFTEIELCLDDVAGTVSSGFALTGLGINDRIYDYEFESYLDTVTAIVNDCVNSICRALGYDPVK